jgi:signal transduction histidine kinase
MIEGHDPILVPSPEQSAARHALPSGLLHEMRTPLNHIIGYSELLIDQAQDEGHDALVPDMKRIRAAGGQLLAFINDRFTPTLSPEHVAVPEEPVRQRDSTLKGPPTGVLPLDQTEGLLLVVDDDATNRDVLARRLERQGYSVAKAENGLQALEMMRGSTFDLVLLDIMMPEMDGLEVLKRLKADEELQHIPVIMISAMSELDSAVQCIEMGAEDYLPKPFDPTLLKARTVACLERKRAHDRENRFTRDLQESNRRAHELESMRDSLTNMIVHDLRTPLTSVISGLQTLESMGGLDEVQREMMDISLSGGQTLLGMINDLLDISKMESGSLQLELGEISPASLVKSAILQVVSLASASEMKLVTEISPLVPTIYADGDKLLRTLVNLLSNAIKFSTHGGIVTIVAHPDDDGRSLQFSVTDAGEGIPPEAFDRIFEKFGQVETRTAGRKHSTGLGLTFCKLVAEAHGGRIWVESEMSKGSTFFFTIPLASI